MKRIAPLLLVSLFWVATACQRAPRLDPLLRARIDGLNKEAFVNRYRDPDSCIVLAQRALQLVADSLPAYADGALRSRNNIAFACYQMSDQEQALRMLDTIDALCTSPDGLAVNADIEQTIAHLLRARLLQRACRISESYRLLYDIGRSGILNAHRDNLLLNYAQSEYYITTLVLNFHYRDATLTGRDMPATATTDGVRALLAEAEARRNDLRVDYAQDMALNYALAYGWQSTGESGRALDYCDRNLAILAIPSAFCPFHYANTLQMTATALRSRPGTVPPDSVLALYDAARSLFLDYGDPYQALGGTVSTASYALLVADTQQAHSVLRQWLDLTAPASPSATAAADPRWQPFAAPKMELALFDVLLRSRMATSTDEALRWHLCHSDLQAYVARSERQDYVLQQTLEATTRRSHTMTLIAMGFALLLVLLLVLLVLLWHSRRRLSREKRQLEAANRRDVERIANVETTLSVLRHDVSPFMGYLRNPSLTDEARREVLDQLLRTFDNIKHWTHLSIPKGMDFHASTFAVDDLFADVRHQSLRPAPGVSLRFESSPLHLWADRMLTTILLRNLVTNAVQHTAEGSIVVSATADHDMVDISIADTGSGMTADQVASLFRADRTLPEGSEHGFGLILCRYIIKKHDDFTRRGCSIHAESIPGLGTTMHCRLAMASPEDPH